MIQDDLDLDGEQEQESGQEDEILLHTPPRTTPNLDIGIYDRRNPIIFALDTAPESPIITPA